MGGEKEVRFAFAVSTGHRDMRSARKAEKVFRKIRGRARPAR